MSSSLSLGSVFAIQAERLLICYPDFKTRPLCLSQLISVSSFCHSSPAWHSSTGRRQGQGGFSVGMLGWVNCGSAAVRNVGCSSCTHGVTANNRHRSPTWALPFAPKNRVLTLVLTAPDPATRWGMESVEPEHVFSLAGVYVNLLTGNQQLIKQASLCQAQGPGVSKQTPTKQGSGSCNFSVCPTVPPTSPPHRT